MPVKAGFTAYLKKAFLYHWNLLALGAGVAVGVITGRSDVVLPLLSAAEIVYLSALVTNSKFQAAIDAEEHKAVTSSRMEQAAENAQRILMSLSRDDRRQYERLKSLCAQLRRISQGVKADMVSEPGIIDDLQTSGINRLLWIYLKLLYSKSALEKFFSAIDESEIEMDIKRVSDRIAELGPVEEDTMSEAKRRKSLEDTLKTSELRRKNYGLARDNYEFILIEIERLYSKIASLSEMSINRQDPDYITHEVDSVSASVHQTEKAMNELEFITGLSSHDEAPPSLIDEDDLFIDG